MFRLVVEPDFKFRQSANVGLGQDLPEDDELPFLGRDSFAQRFSGDNLGEEPQPAFQRKTAGLGSFCPRRGKTGREYTRQCLPVSRR